MNSPLNLDRRTFMRRGAMGAGALWALSLHEMTARANHRGSGPNVINGISPYGPIRPTKDQTTGLELLQLPADFKYFSYSWTGDVMSDGVVCPNLHDGMAVIEANPMGHDRKRNKPATGGLEIADARDSRRKKNTELVLVRNHEGGGGTPYISGRRDITYSGAGIANGSGGTTNLVFDTENGWLAARSSLAGTIRNCAGGVTPWNSWLTCEETTDVGHGWTFEVFAEGGDTTPLKALGRFSHEADMIDPKTGYVYETEDSGDSGFFRFVPNRRGRLEMGGRLYMLAVKGSPNLNLSASLPLGSTFDVEWVPIDDPEAISGSCYAQGAAQGGARFARLEGAWWGDETGYFLSTSGGTVGEGQVFEYNPEDETIKLIYDAPNSTELDNPDNITVTPRGGLLLCEDAAGNGFTQGERLIGLTLHGQTFTFGMNNIVLTSNYNSVVRAGDYRQNEWAGACYSPDGRWLFVNIQTPGITFAITGPWGEGPL
jgi:secreted PhoX family phosphatase